MAERDEDPLRPHGLRLGLPGLLPADVAVCQTTRELREQTPFPGESEIVSGAVASRRLEFESGRTCARLALLALGQEAVALPRAADRGPVWPVGVVGSITHTMLDGTPFRAAAAVRVDVAAGLGIDAEPALPLPADLDRHVGSAEERRCARQVAGGLGTRLLFAAKEAAYKALRGEDVATLDLLDVSTSFYATESLGGVVTGRFVVALPPGYGTDPDGHPARCVTGRWLAAPRLLATAVLLPPARLSTGLRLRRPPVGVEGRCWTQPCMGGHGESDDGVAEAP